MTPTPTQALEPVEVTQDDRDAAQAYLDDPKHNISRFTTRRILDEAFARHRQSSNAASVDIDDVLNDAYVRGWDDHRGDVKFAPGWEKALVELRKHPSLASLSTPIDDRPDFVGDPVCKIAAYNECHETALELGYPSLTEALEHLSELKEAPPPDSGPHPLGQEYDWDALREAAQAVVAEAERMTMTMRRRKIFDALARALSDRPQAEGEVK